VGKLFKTFMENFMEKILLDRHRSGTEDSTEKDVRDDVRM
jgi:hypothetical protein